MSESCTAPAIHQNVRFVTHWHSHVPHVDPPPKYKDERSILQMSDNKNGGYADDCRAITDKAGVSRTFVHAAYDGKIY
jgi:hypothetical protein